MYSTGVQTPLSFYYAGSDFSKQPVTTNGDGDGTVNVRSLQLCEVWGSTQQEAVTVHTFQNVAHADMIKEDGVIQVVLNATIGSSRAMHVSSAAKK